jgi:hypothetical protein
MLAPSAAQAAFADRPDQKETSDSKDSFPCQTLNFIDTSTTKRRTVLRDNRTARDEVQPVPATEGRASELPLRQEGNLSQRRSERYGPRDDLYLALA